MLVRIASSILRVIAKEIMLMGHLFLKVFS